MLGPAQRVAVVKGGGEKERQRTSPAPRRKPDWDSSLQDRSAFRLTPEESRRRKELATSAHLAEARDEVAMRLNPLAADLDNIGEPHGARHGAGAHSELEREAAKALGELSRVQAELRALAPHVGHGGTAAARERDSEYDDPRDGPSDDEGAREGEGEEQAGQSSERPPTAPRSHTRLKGALGSADRDGTDLLAFATPGGGAGSRARRAAAFGSPAPGTPRAAEAHGRAPDKLGLHRVEHAAASLAEGMRRFEAAHGGKPMWRSPGTPGGVSGVPSAPRPRTAGPQPGAHAAHSAHAGSGGGTYGGYTEMLVGMSTKLLGYLGEAEARIKAEESARKRVTADFEKRLATLEGTANEARDAAAAARIELEATRKSHGATLDALVAKVATLEHASGHAHVSALLATLQTGAPPPAPASQPVPRQSSAAVTPVRATAWAQPSAAHGPGEPPAEVLSGMAAPSNQQAPPYWGTSAADHSAPYVAVRGVNAGHRAPSPGPLAPAHAPQHLATPAAEEATSFAAWPHVTHATAPGAPAHAAARGWSPARPPTSSLAPLDERAAQHDDAGPAVVAPHAPPPLSAQQPQPYATPDQAAHPPAANPPGPSSLARLMITAAEGAAQLRPPRAAAFSGKSASGPVRALRDSTNAHPAPAARAQAKPSAANGRAAAQRDIGI